MILRYRVIGTLWQGVDFVCCMIDRHSEGLGTLLFLFDVGLAGRAVTMDIDI